MPADAFAEQNVKLGRLERRGHLVFHHFDLGLVANGVVALFDGAGTADVEPDRSVELERIPARGGFGRAKHDADLHADLVDEDHHAVGLLDVGREFAQRLAHQPCLQTGQAVAHFTFEFCLRRQRRHGVDDDQVDRP